MASSSSSSAPYTSTSPSSSSNPDVRIHSLLCTPKEVSDGASFLSDHLPQIATIGGLVILTWNLHERTFGFDPSSGFSANSESSDNFLIRRGYITKALEKMIEKHQPHLIFLQEVGDYSVEFFMLSDYAAARCTIEKRDKGLCVLYNKNFYHAPTCIQVPLIKYVPKKSRTKDEEKQDLDETYREKTLHLVFDGVEVFVVHWPHREMPHEAEEQIRMIIEKRRKRPFTIIGGDFNNRICPVIQTGTSTPPYLVSSVTNRIFRKFVGNVQGGDWIDSFVYVQDEKKHIQQPKTETLNPYTGNIWVETPPTFKGFQKIEVERQRLCLSITPDDMKLIHDTFPPSVIPYLKSKGIHVGRSSNAYRQIMPAIYCSELTEQNERLITEFMMFNALKPEKYIDIEKEFTERGCLLPIPVEQCRIKPASFFVLWQVHDLFQTELEKYKKIVDNRFLKRQDPHHKLVIEKTIQLFSWLLTVGPTRVHNQPNELSFNVDTLVQYLKNVIKTTPWSSNSKLKPIYEKMWNHIPHEMKEAKPPIVSLPVSTPSTSDHVPHEMKETKSPVVSLPVSTPSTSDHIPHEMKEAKSPIVSLPVSTSSTSSLMRMPPPPAVPVKRESKLPVSLSSTSTEESKTTAPISTSISPDSIRSEINARLQNLDTALSEGDLNLSQLADISRQIQEMRQQILNHTLSPEESKIPASSSTPVVISDSAPAPTPSSLGVFNKDLGRPTKIDLDKVTDNIAFFD